MNGQGVTGGPPIDAETVARLVEMAGFDVAPERLGAIAERLSDLYRLAAVLDDLNLDGVAPAADFDPRWGEVSAEVPL